MAPQGYMPTAPKVSTLVLFVFDSNSLWYLVCVSVSVCLLLNISLLKRLFMPQTNSPIQEWMNVKILRDVRSVAELEHSCYSTGAIGQPFLFRGKRARV